ncbi:hypothetical protein [Thermophilibacter mediterraneus]|nr:hypothetical protein [Thermophilibacter mediterraneus]
MRASAKTGARSAWVATSPLGRRMGSGFSGMSARRLYQAVGICCSLR